MSSNNPMTLLSLSGPGGSLTVSVQRRDFAPPSEEPWFDAEIAVQAHPFAGTLQTVLTLADLRDWSSSLAALESQPGQAVLGGDRAVELALGVVPQVGGREGGLAITVELTPCGDDPYPFLRYLIFDAEHFWRNTCELIGRLVQAQQR
jgi:hypothetical protein